MAHVRVRTTSRGRRYVARYQDADGKERSKTFRSQANAERFLIQVEAAKLSGTYQDPGAGRLTFDQWADRWWEVWAGDPERSPTTLASAESRLRLHLRPRFGRHKLGEIRPSLVRQWQHELHGRLAHASVLACRSLLNRILRTTSRGRRYVARYQDADGKERSKTFRSRGAQWTRKSSSAVPGPGSSPPSSSASSSRTQSPRSETGCWCWPAPACGRESCAGCAASGCSSASAGWRW
jgi:hypothetical protein